MTDSTMSETPELSRDCAAASEEVGCPFDAPAPSRSHEPFSIARQRAAARMAAARTAAYQLAKRLFDFVVAGCLLALLSPLLLLIAVAIKLDSPGPVLFTQLRTGRYGKPFRFIKFRSLSDKDHTVIHREFMQQFATSAYGTNQHALYKPTSNAQVITNVGKRLRRYSLDELPQLWNILKGDMSLVGPRAWPVYELENYQDWHYRRLDVPPGLTGLAQVNGRSRLSYDEMIRLDITYVERRSMLLDLKILTKTVPVVISGEDAG